MKNISQKYLYLFLVIIPVLIGIIAFWSFWKSSYTGIYCQYREGNWYISSIDDNGPANKYIKFINARLISIDDWDIQGKELAIIAAMINTPQDFTRFLEAQKYFAQNISIDKKLNIVVEYDKVQSVITIQPVSPQIITVITKVWPMYLIAFFFLLFATILIIKKSDDPRVRIFFLLSIMASIEYMIFGVHKNLNLISYFYLYVVLDVMRILAILYAMALVLHFSMVFPHSMNLSKNTLFLTVIYIIPIFVFLLTWLRIFTFAYLLFVLVYLSITIILLLYNYKMNSSPVEKTQIKWVIWGFSIFIIGGSLLFYIPIILTGHPVVEQDILLLFGIIIPLSMTFAIMKYKLMDIDTLFDNTLIYSVTIGLLAMIDVVVVYVLTTNKIPLLTFPEPFPTVIAVWVIIFAYLPVRNLVRDNIKRILKREVYDINEVFVSYSKQLLSANTLDEVMNKAKKVIEKALHPKNIDLELLDNPKELQLLVNTENGEALIPLTTNTGSIGLIALGEKHSGRLYDRDDIRLLNTIANQTALAIESIRHREGIRLKEEENRAEKERISKEIHDGIGSSLVQAKLLVDMAQGNPAKLSEASGIIDNGIKEMRELIWVVEQDNQTLGNLVYHIENRMEQAKSLLPINIDTNIENENIILTPEQKLNISRIVQESMTNIIKHAQASRVDISFVEKNKYLEIIIRDSGKGFDMSTTGSESYGLRNMRARAEKIGARFDISSQIAKGSELRLEIQL